MSSENEWILLRVSAEMIDYARQRHALLMATAATLPVKVRAVADPARRSWGIVAELALRKWFDRQGAHVVAYGGVDSNPDLEVNGISVGVKFCRYHGRYQPTNNVHVFDAHRGSARQWAFLGNVGEHEDEILLLGFASAAEIEAGRPAEAGVPLPSGFVPAEALHELYVWQLKAPLEWLRAFGP